MVTKLGKAKETLWLMGLALAVMQTGCAISYQDDNGVVNRVGLVWVKEHQGSERVVTQTEVLGVDLRASGPGGTGITLGHRNDIRVTPSDPDTYYEIDYDENRPMDAQLKKVRHRTEPVAEPSQDTDSDSG